MRRRSRASSKPTKARSRTAVTSGRRDAPTVRRRRSSAEAQETEFARLARKRDEALEQLSAATHVLTVIGSSPGDLEPVFQTMLENAVRICAARFGVLFLAEGDTYRVVAMHNVPESYREVRKREPTFRYSPSHPLARVAATKQMLQIADLQADASYAESDSSSYRAMVGLAGARTMLLVPMLRENEFVGQIAIFRQEVLPFSEKQIELVQNFAAQAVIAFENARLLNELRESLDQQTATSEVLRVISSSPGELKPDFNAMLENAIRLCESEAGNLYLYDGEAFHAAALHSASQAYTEMRRRRPVVLRELHPDTPLGRMARTRAVVHTADVRTAKGYIERDPRFSEFVDLSGARTHLAVPMVKENELIGAIDTYRLEVRPFTDKQIALVQSFAAQAVIAIENARLLNELRQSLEQQTTSEVL